jgi:hypothetical protein
VSGELQVARGGNGQELGDPFDDSKNDDGNPVRHGRRYKLQVAGCKLQVEKIWLDRDGELAT